MNEKLLLERWRGLDVTVRDLPLALVLVVGSLLPSSQGHGTQLGNLPARPFDALAVVVVLMQSLPLLGRRKWPLACLAVVSLGFFVDQVRGYHSLAGTALAVALFSAGAYQERHRRSTAVLLSAAYVVLAVRLDQLGSGEQVGGFVQFYLLLVLAWGAGVWWRFTRATEARSRRAEAAVALAAERTRIAGELHDVVTHHVTAMVVQTEAAHYLTAAPEKLTATLTEVAETGRRAISDLRHLLDLLDPEHGSEEPVRPGEVEALVEQARRAGQPVEFVQEGKAAVSSGSAEFVTYRVVQETLTNALKHARGSATAVSVQHRPQDITVEVRTRAAAATGESVGETVGGSGRGLAGLRERVALLGGEFSARRCPDGDFVVRARIPSGAPS
ncbi:signal transduction histidine kinase [Kineococcus radiotolerans]|uniref:histidine kinase n=1 Tax=Kineococcus radiotolerans TaxID=131568 RepID=A0A7W4TRB5_KINRA|nr:sensor histidine kinase [Kineococcus radiotolerans]MBB2903267.1 signal transduction histidine kinase [Kineococcus radiotolerans]